MRNHLLKATPPIGKVPGVGYLNGRGMLTGPGVSRLLNGQPPYADLDW